MNISKIIFFSQLTKAVTNIKYSNQQKDCKLFGGWVNVWSFYKSLPILNVSETRYVHPLYYRSSSLLLLNRTCIYLSQWLITFHAILLNDIIYIFLYTPRYSKRIPMTLIHLLNIYFKPVDTTNYLSSWC